MEERTEGCTPRRLCLRCDNRHGCRTPEPPCLTLPRAPDERRLPGRSLMARRGLLPRCQDCPLFRQCWRPGDYRAVLAAAGPDGRGAESAPPDGPAVPDGRAVPAPADGGMGRNPQ